MTRAGVAGRALLVLLAIAAAAPLTPAAAATPATAHPSAAPAAPTNLTADAENATAVMLSWVVPGFTFAYITTDEVNVSTYSGSCGSYSAATLKAATSTSATAIGLSGNSAYCFEVAVGNSTGIGATSSAIANVRTAKAGTTAVSLTVQPAAFTDNLAQYFGVNDWFMGAPPSSQLTNLTDRTPISVVRIDSDADRENLSLGVTYNSGTGGGPGAAQSNPLAAWNYCESLRSCLSIMALPGETNSTGDLRSALLWSLEVGIRPNYYTIGQEPAGWVHFGIPWTSWKVTDNSAPTALQYALEVQRMIPVVRSLVPGAQVVGIEDNECLADTQISRVAQIDGPNISAIACHAYPADYGGSDKAGASLSAMYSTAATYGLNTLIPAIRTLVASECPGRTIPVWVDEENTQWGLNVSTDPAGWRFYETAYPGAAYTAAIAITGLEVDLAHVLYWSVWPEHGDTTAIVGNGAGYGAGAYATWPVYNFYSYFAPNLTGGAFSNVTFAGSAAPLFGAFMRGASSASLYVVALTTNQTLSLSWSTPVAGAIGATALYWAGIVGTTPTVVQYAAGALPTNYTIAPGGMLLVDYALAPPAAAGGLWASLAWLGPYWLPLAAALVGAVLLAIVLRPGKGGSR